MFFRKEYIVSYFILCYSAREPDNKHFELQEVFYGLYYQFCRGTRRI